MKKRLQALRGQQQQQGATLIELSVVVVIIALIVAGALISFRQVQRSQTVTSAAATNANLVSAIARISGAVGPGGAGLMACSPTGCLISGDTNTRISTALDNALLGASATGWNMGGFSLARSGGATTGNGYSSANPWGGDIVIYAFNPRSVVIRHDGVQEYATDPLTNALTLGAIFIASDDATRAALSTSSSLGYVVGSDYGTATYASSDGALSYVDALYQF